MKKLIAVLAVLVSFSASAQILFYYGNDSVSVKEFLRAYHKNNTGAKTGKAFNDYLRLYITSRLKIKEASQRGYDTLPQMMVDLENLRQQIIPSYLNDKQSVNKLVNEALQRSQKDIHLAHIFISFTQNGVYDSVAANRKLNEVLKKIHSTDFSDLAHQYSDDPSAKINGGDLDYITVFTLPYELENLAYSTPAGHVSAPYRSRAGYHIFKNLGERRDIGRIKAAEILLAFPPEADNKTKEHTKALADSLYNRLHQGDDFGKLAAQFSNDVISSAANGQMQEFGVGQYDPVFQKQVYGLARDGEITKPFLTSHGYHIVKRLGRQPLQVTKNDAKTLQSLKQRVEQSDRMKTTTAALAKRIIKEAGYKKASFSDEELWAYTDSVINFTKPRVPYHLTNSSVLFRLGDKMVTVPDWVNYAQTFRYKPDGSGVKSYSQIWDEFVEARAVDYYQTHLESFNEEFRQQVTEFKEGNLFFEIMQRQVWGPAQSDSMALVQYYNRNRSKYTWKKSADAVIFYANDETTARTYSVQLKKNPSSWHNLVNSFSEKIAADSARFDISQIPNPSHMVLAPGTITAPLVNKADNTTSFAYVLHIYDRPAPRSFTEAKGLVINDYQNEVEKNWVAELQKKYPVRINEKVLSKLVKSE